MLNVQETLSAGEQEVPVTDSVYDFLYYDAERIASFLSQFNNFGHLQQIHQQEHEQRSKEESNNKKGGVNLSFASGDLSSQKAVGFESGQQQQKVYDPRWTNALNFLNHLDENCLISRDIGNTSLGQIVLFSGRLNLFDFSILRGILSSSMIKDFISLGVTPQSNRKERRRSGAYTNKASRVPNEAELGIEVLSVLPNTIAASVSRKGISLWFTLNDQKMAVSSVELFLKNGTSITGTWNILGILDAVPSGKEEIDIEDIIHPQPLQLGNLADTLSPALVDSIRGFYGRPDTAYGVTPLLIFREVNRTATAT